MTVTLRPTRLLYDFRDWLWTKPSHGLFDYNDNGNCCYAQFLRETGRAKSPVVGGSYWFEEGASPIEDRPIPEELRERTLRGRPFSILQQKTYGSVLKRLEETLGE